MEVERDYFASHAPTSASARPVLAALAVDFDQTLTQRDTCSLLLGAAEEAQVAQAFAQARASGSGKESSGRILEGASQAEAVRRGLADTLQELLAQYGRERDAAMDAVVRAAAGGGAPTGESAPAALGVSPASANLGASPAASLLVPLDAADSEAMLRAQRLLAGISPHDLALLGGRVSLRPGAAAALRRALQGGAEVWVVSVSWSAAFVAAVLRANGLPAAEAVKRDGKWTWPEGDWKKVGPHLLVIANALETPADGVPRDVTASWESVPEELRRSTGTLAPDRQVFCAGDKAAVFADLLAAAEERAAQTQDRLREAIANSTGNGNVNGNGNAAAEKRSDAASAVPLLPLPLASAYLGDSLTDLSPALLATRAVFFECGRSLARACDALGVEVAPISAVDGCERRPTRGEANAAGPASPGGSGAPRKTLHVTDNWTSAENDLNAHFVLPRDACARALAEVSGDASASSPLLQGAPLASLFPPLASPIRVPKILTIAGSDSSGGAGIEADQRAAQANGARASVGAVALTSQDSHGVHASHRVPDAFARDAARRALLDAGVDCVKTGMLPDAHAVDEAVAMTRLARGLDAGAHLVVDPVLVATSGDSLADATALAAIRDRLLPLADVATPNLPEAAALLGRKEPIRGVAQAVEAAVELLALGPRWVLLKGGHEQDGDEIVDVLVGRQGEGERDEHADEQEDQPGERGLERLYADADARFGPSIVPPPCPPSLVRCDRIDLNKHDDAFALLCSPSALALARALRPSVRLLRAPRLTSNNLHGTGCTLASSIAARLAAGDEVVEAVRSAKAYVWRTIERSRDLPLGTGPQRSLNHGWAVADWRQAAAARGNADARRIASPVDLSVYVVTDPGCDARNNRSLVESVAAAVEGGATIVQIRAKDADAGAFVREARQALAVCRAAGVPLVINDRLDVALAIGADGAHIGQTDVPAADARRILGPALILGVSAVTPADVRAAARAGADYVGVGAVHSTTTKDANVCGVEGLGRACQVAHQEGITAVAIGGLNAANLGDAIRAGADGAAIVSAIFGRPDVAEATREIAKAVHRARASDAEAGSQ